MTRRTTAALLGAVTLVALLGGCSGNPTEAKTAGPPGSWGTAGESGTTSTDRPAPGVIGSCMRGKGYDFDDSDAVSDEFAAPAGVDGEQWAADLLRCSGVDDQPGDGADTEERR
jgi:hypothetical protein